jgi:hypothetical protein
LFILSRLGMVVATTAGLYGEKSSGLTGATTFDEFVFRQQSSIECAKAGDFRRSHQLL